MNIKTIDQIIQKYDLSRKDKENNIYYYLNKGLNSEKQKYISFINNKRNRNDVKIGEELEKKIKIYHYKDSFYDEGIVIEQKNKNGKNLDFGFLYGKKNSKIYIGFQMKKYSYNVKLNKETKIKLNKKI